MDKAKTVVNRRRTYFIEKGFQARFILRFCTLVVLGGCLSIGVIYFLATRSTTVAIVNSRVVVRTTADFILPLLIQTVVIVSALVGLATIVLALLASHKIAGPLYRFKKVVKALEEGDFSSDFKIRKRDQLRDLAEGFNSMINKVRSELKALKNNLATLKHNLDNLSENEVREEKRHYLGELKKVFAEVARIIENFKT